MGNTIERTKRTCQNVFTFSKASVSVSPGDVESPPPPSSSNELQDIDENGEIDYMRMLEEERLRRETLEKEHEETLTALRRYQDDHYEADKLHARESVHGKVSVELDDLRTTIRQLSEDLQQPVEETEQVLEHWRTPYTKLDDYVLETMFALLHWLATQAHYRPLTMAQLLFFLKSEHIRARRKYVMRTERILRETGLSLFDLQQTCDPLRLAEYFDVVRKRVALSKVAANQPDVVHLTEHSEGARATWHGLVC